MRALNKSVFILVIAVLAGCGQQLVEFADRTFPTVSATDPVNSATGVGVSRTVNATFSEAMDPASITTGTFTLKQGSTAISGSVSYAGMTATFTPSADLSANVFTATVSTGAKSAAGNALQSDYTWTFTTKAGGFTGPAVNSTDPGNSSTGVVTNKQITATFSRAMDPLTITATTFTLKQGTTSIPGAVSYAGTTAKFIPTSLLAAGTVYDATITVGAKDPAGLAIASDYKWSFTTAATSGPAVVATDPLNLATNVPINKQISAVFNKAMDPTTITTSTFTVRQGTNPPLAGNVSYAGNTATFAPTNKLAPNTTYTATVTTGAKDTAATALAADFVWSFTTEAAPQPALAINLGSAASFGIASSAGMTSTGVTVVNGDVALSPTATCTDATGGAPGGSCLSNKYAKPLGMTVNGSIFYAGDAWDNGVTAANVKSDLNKAWIEGKNKANTQAVGFLTGDISGKTIVAGVYEEGSTLTMAVGATATMDGAGDRNAVFIFKVGSSLTFNSGSTIALINGAQARNVWFIVALDASINTGVTGNGNVLAGQTVSVLAGAHLLGRVLGGAIQGGSGAISLSGDATTVTSITVPE